MREGEMQQRSTARHCIGSRPLGYLHFNILFTESHHHKLKVWGLFEATILDGGSGLMKGSQTSSQGARSRPRDISYGS